jgi:hypothetical protein
METRAGKSSSGGKKKRVRAVAVASVSPHAAPIWHAFARGVALFLAALIAMNVAGELEQPGFDSNLGWIDLRPCPPAVLRGLLTFAAVLFVGYALFPRMNALRKSLTALVVVSMLGVSVWRTVLFYQLLKQGELKTEFEIPFALHVSIVLLLLLAGVAAAPRRPVNRGRNFLLVLLTAAICGATFPLVEMYSSGKTDYRKDADVAVVIAGRSNSLNRAAAGPDVGSHETDRLSEQVNVACDLYHEGLVKRLVFSGSQNEAGRPVTQDMRSMALKRNVPEQALILDAESDTTEDSVRGTTDIVLRLEAERVLAVGQ